MSRKYYLIDTENVGNRWLDMPHKIRRKDRIVTFYTENHSKHLEKFLSKQVHNPSILWLECATGENALDYQLMGVLSYLITKHPKAAFCIYSNDKDYHDAIAFWKSRGIKICQKGFKIKKKAKKKKSKSGQNSKTKKSSLSVSLESVKTSVPKLTEEQYMAEISKALPVSNLTGWHQALTAVFGQKKGHDWYLRLKDDAQLQAGLSANCTADADARGISLVATVLNRHGLDAANAEEAYKTIRSHNPKNLNAIKIDFDKKFGNTPPQKYYKVLRPLFRTLKEIS